MRRFLLKGWNSLRGEIVFGFLIASVFWAGVLGWQAAYAPTDAVKRVCYDAAHNADHKSEECKSFWEKATSDPVAFFTLVLAISTIGLWVATIFLYCAGERQLQHTRRSATVQSRDMQASVAAANRSAAAAERALTELEAPFLSVIIKDAGISPSWSESGETFGTLRFSFANHGRTPARLIELADKIKFIERNEGLPPEIDPGFASRNSMPYGVIVPPQGESQEWTQNLFAETIKFAVDGIQPLRSNTIFFYGFVRYGTIFNEVFRTGFCFIYDVTSGKWLLAGGDRHNYCHKETNPPKPLI